MVSNARLDFPEPDKPVTTISLSRGISSDTFLRLCTRAPCTAIDVRATVPVVPVEQRFLVIRKSPCAVLSQELRNLCMTAAGRPGERRGPRRIIGQLRFGAVLQQQFNHCVLAESGCQSPR